jgi:hypothetical protein
LGKDHWISSNAPSNDVDNVLSVFAFPHITLALVCNAFPSPTCHHTTTMTCALASLLVPLAVACTLYMLGVKNVCVIGVHVPCIPSQKSRMISFTFPLLIAVNVVISGALHSNLSMLI